ncbi:S-type anion channel SLAH2 isoform X2 [Selaginella moellendorffii]|uniref:S-type anion channel SLAH2 isoform X2 n=1 Tax=Selaginella moellendorffii TaxID=88036 RepID=UPI000D1CA7A9|nr:S-type anion channel SLAH2 isoform X2 [Selaginella moellendorffii]|eukprot:XP_024515181.1 S-type anion channel SLAH2 isoform X2 [Selaginella moellendorffii]
MMSDGMKPDTGAERINASGDRLLIPMQQQLRITIDNGYAAFSTCARKLTRDSKDPNLMKNSSNSMDEESALGTTSNAPVPTGRYFDALQGPELEVVEESEQDLLLLPMDKVWPFLLRFPVNSFGIVLGLGSQGILWKSLSSTPAMEEFVHIPKQVNLVLWCATLLAFVAISLTYLLKCFLYFEAVRREFFHPVRINYFFAPCIGGMFLAIGLPDAVGLSLHPSWLSGGDRRLSKVANPSTHLSIVGNFVGAVLGARVGWKEPAMFFWAVGLAHYMVLFVTLYQRLPTNKRLPKDLHPVFFLFVAAPSTASVAWEDITGSFGYVSRIVYFVSLFLLLSLVVRVNLFRGFRFSISWWAYTFPLGAAAIATIHYYSAVTCTLTRFLVVALSLASVLVVVSIFVTTLACACLYGTLFPNDQAIAITSEQHRKQHQLCKQQA